MKVSRAIEELKIYLQNDLATYTLQRADAVKLGIEALKRHQRALKGFTHPAPHLLPGETLEKE